mmetsp:Transcript_11372/g.15290  ORF Transcript_11372/g.15290 Transcript_11372/m.15290 type:complete len:216 (-) Transcript_11372:668-1315(-)
MTEDKVGDVTSPQTRRHTVVKSMSSPEFARDIAPYFLATYAFVISHIVYQVSGNLLVPIWLAYVVNLNTFWRKDYGEMNLDEASERTWSRDKRFLLPLYAFVAVDTLNWLWCMCVVAGANPLAQTALSFIFESKHGDSFWNQVVFTFVWGYMAGLNGLAGHELIHKREPHNKTIGLSTFTKILYSHFYLEHGSGHHRFVATELDPATARKGETFY